MPVFVSVIVTLAFPTAAPDESVTAPSKVAFTAWPMTCAEHARSTNASATAAVISPKWTRLPFGAHAGDPFGPPNVTRVSAPPSRSTVHTSDPVASARQTRTC